MKVASANDLASSEMINVSNLMIFLRW